MAEPFTIESADLKLTGSETIIVADRSSGIVSQIESDGVSSYTVTVMTTEVGANWRDIAVGDFEGDGDVDVLIAGMGSNSIELLLSTCCPVNQV
jgi:hypothetical protein